MQGRWTLSVGDGRGGATEPVAEWDGTLPFSWRVLASGRCRVVGPGVVGHLRTGLARFGKLEALIGFAVGDVEPDLAAAMRREATALNRLQGLVVMLQATGPAAPPLADLRRLCTASGRAVNSLRRDTLFGPRRLVNAARAGRGPLAPLAGLRLDADHDAPGTALPLGLVFADALASKG
ncbi:MAG TPA: hypothetical protein DDY29_01915 [Rhodobacteraceae bacterium]|nr:hypothetical protein [Paracoccaceae bacterium]HBG97521.1 hypothetical protein [Paracoccaceae bacterium]